jgi:hypothetical protein
VTGASVAATVDGQEDALVGCCDGEGCLAPVERRRVDVACRPRHPAAAKDLFVEAEARAEVDAGRDVGAIGRAVLGLEDTCCAQVWRGSTCSSTPRGGNAAGGSSERVIRSRRRTRACRRSLARSRSFREEVLARTQQRRSARALPERRLRGRFASRLNIDAMPLVLDGSGALRPCRRL